MLIDVLEKHKCTKISDGDIVGYLCDIEDKPFEVLANKVHNVVYIKVPKYYDEIITPELLEGSRMMSSHEEVKEYVQNKIGKFKMRELEEKGTLAIARAFYDILESEFNEKVREITAKPGREIKLSEKTRLIISPDVIEIKHGTRPLHRYYSGKVCKIIDVEDKTTLEKAFDICLSSPP